MKVLVTGAAGFIGQHLVRDLDSAGHEVAGRDIRTDGHDLRVPGVAGSLVEAAEPDAVVHLAARVGRLFGEDAPWETIEDNATMTTLVAQAAAEHGARLAYASTSEVYGDLGSTVAFESGRMRLPHNLYGLTKRWAEEACQLYAPDGLVTLRFSMPYGPGAPPGRGRRALDNMLWQAHHGQPIPVHKGAARSWCWIGDLCRGVRMILESGETGAFNVGRDDAEITMFELARRACDLAGASHDLIQEVDPPSRQTVVKRLATQRLRSLGWKPEVDLDEGMGRVYEWVRLFDAEGRFTDGESRAEAAA